MTKRTVLITADVVPMTEEAEGLTLIDGGFGRYHINNDLIMTPDRIRAMLELADLGDLYTGDGQFVSHERLAQALGVVGDAEEPEGALAPIPEGMTMVHQVEGKITLVFVDMEDATPVGVTGIEWRDRMGIIQTLTFETPFPIGAEGDVLHRAGQLWVKPPAA